MAYFVPMGHGTISEDGSTLISNPGSGITKAGWGGGPPTPPPVDEADEGCQMVITANGQQDKLWEIETEDGLDVDFEAVFTGDSCSGDWEYFWEIPGGTEPEESVEESPTQHYDDVREYIVSLQVTCKDCSPSYLEDYYDLEIFVPVVEIKEDEEHENGKFELKKESGLFSNDFYLERTNLIIEVKYPEDHPEAGEIISDYSGEAKVTEEKSTTYYNDEGGASELPDDIDIEDGKGQFSLDSLSDEIANSDGPNGWPKDAKIEIDIEEFDYLDADSIKSVDVEQWVKDSDLEVSGNSGDTNNSVMPDWLEKQAWDEMQKYQSQGDVIGAVISSVQNIYYINEDEVTPGHCGSVPAKSTAKTLWLSATCHIVVGDDVNSHRKNTSDWLSRNVLHEARHVWQNEQLLLTPANATGEEPKQDSDGDGCPEVVLNDGTDAGPQDDSSIQDGVFPTTGDDEDDSDADNAEYFISPYPWDTSLRVSKCNYLREVDSVEFMFDNQRSQITE